MLRTVTILLSTALLTLPAFAQKVPSDTSRTSSPGDTLTIRVDTRTTVGNALATLGDTLAMGEERTTPGGPEILFLRDTLLLHDYHNVGDVVARIPGISKYGLGGHGHPSWLSYLGSHPSNQSITRDQMPVKDYITGMQRLEMIPFEDAEHIMVYPQHQAFWYGGNGALLAADVTSKDWDAYMPHTRIRHMFGPHEYLYTDVLFTMNPGEHDNVAVGLTRQTYGINDAGQFRNSHIERWDLRLRYRYDISDRLRLTIGDRYNDYFTRTNGGIAGTLTADSAHFVYPNPALSDEAQLFDPILAEIINPTILVKESRNAAFATARMKWFDSESMVTQARVAFETGQRQYEDKGYIFAGEFRGQSAVNNSPIIGRAWTNLRLDAEHKASIGWAELELGGALTSLSAEHDSAWFGRTSGVTSMVRGLLRFEVRPFRLTGFTRLENTYGQNTYGFGGTLETQPTESLVLWGGASISTRPYSLFELYYIGDRALGATRPNPDLEQHILTEGGIRYRSGWLETDARVFVRRTNRGLYISGQMYPADSLHSRFSPVWNVADIPSTTSGISVYAKTGVWLMHLELRAAAMTQQFDNATYARNTAPDLQGTADVYLRANELFVSTLDLKIGARAAYSGAYHPMLYLPEQGWFGLPAETGASNFADRYTEYVRIDAFLFATIRRLATLHILVYNVLDENIITTQFYPMPDMGIQFGVDWLLLE